MLFLAYKFLEPWFSPLGAACVLLLAGLVLLNRRPRTGRMLAGLALALLWLSGTSAVSGRLLARLEGRYPVPPASKRADAAVVLAGMVDLARSTQDRPELRDGAERIIEGAKLVKSGRARILLISGGSGDPLRPDASEADVLARLALELGVPPRSILVQSRSRTTWEDARYTAELVRANGIGRFFLVTSASHLPRAVGCFRRAGLDPIPYPVDFRATPPVRDVARYTPTAAGLKAATVAFHEYVGYGLYWLSGRVRR